MGVFLTIVAPCSRLIIFIYTLAILYHVTHAKQQRETLCTNSAIESTVQQANSNIVLILLCYIKLPALLNKYFNQFMI